MCKECKKTRQKGENIRDGSTINFMWQKLAATTLFSVLAVNRCCNLAGASHHLLSQAAKSAGSAAAAPPLAASQQGELRGQKQGLWYSTVRVG